MVNTTQAHISYFGRSKATNSSDSKIRIIVTVAAEETLLSSTVYSPLQCFYYVHIIQMELPLFDFQASSPSQAASQSECLRILQSPFELLNTTSFYSISFLQISFQTQGVLFWVFWEYVAKVLHFSALRDQHFFIQGLGKKSTKIGSEKF